MIETIAESGVRTDDSPYIEAAQADYTTALELDPQNAIFAYYRALLYFAFASGGRRRSEVAAADFAALRRPARSGAFGSFAAAPSARGSAP